MPTTAVPTTTVPAAAVPTAAAPAPSPATTETEHDRWGVVGRSVIAGIRIAIWVCRIRIGIVGIAGGRRLHRVAMRIDALGIADVILLLHTAICGVGVVRADRAAGKQAGGPANDGTG